MKISTLRLLSISYLLLPNLLFAVYWFRWEVSCLILAGYFYFSWLEIKGYISDNEKILFTLRDIIFIGIIALSWTLLTGTGGFFRQSSDFWGHNTKFYDLTKNDWPIYFKEVNTYACYYFSYYLVPSFFSKIIGFLSPALIILWTFAGFFAGLLWVYFFS